jgi:hypothetical protein
LPSESQKLLDPRSVSKLFEGLQSKLILSTSDISKFCDDQSEGSFTNLLSIVILFPKDYGLDFQDKDILNGITSKIMQTKKDLNRHRLLNNEKEIKECETELINHCLRVCGYVREILTPNQQQVLTDSKPKLLKDLGLIKNIQIDYFDIIETISKIDSEIHKSLVSTSRGKEEDSPTKMTKLLAISSLAGGLRVQWERWIKQVENHLGETYSKISKDSERILESIDKINNRLLTGDINDEAYCAIKHLEQIVVGLGKIIAPSILNEARGEVE